ncbi:VP8 [Eriocheir sinensis reovirus]|uniref:VP8 n=1 Tax=Eriocheir sinensis reovirus TaxID=273810 RepID=A0A0E3X9I1_ESRV|nr:VP8 [Eriocheir sinensis reovirus]AKC01927.1 VP8 [Eriocheir sinensis reovirus]
MSIASNYADDHVEDNHSVSSSQPAGRDAVVSLPATAFDDIMKRLAALEMCAADTAAENQRLHQQIALLKGEEEQVGTKTIQITVGIYQFDVEVPEDKEEDLTKGLSMLLRVGANTLKSHPKGLVDALETTSRVVGVSHESLSYYDKLPALTKDVIWQKPDSFTLSGFTIHSAAELMSVAVKDAGDDDYCFLQNIGGHECVITAGTLFTRILLLSGWRNSFNLEQKSVQKLIQPVQPRRQHTHQERSAGRSIGKTLRAEVARLDQEDERVVLIPRRPETPPLADRLYFNRSSEMNLQNA